MTDASSSGSSGTPGGGRGRGGPSGARKGSSAGSGNFGGKRAAPAGGRGKPSAGRGRPSPDGDRGKPAFGERGKPASTERGKAAAGNSRGKPSSAIGKAKPPRAHVDRGPKPFGNERFGKSMPPAKSRGNTGRRRPSSPAPQSELHDPEGVRLQKILAGAGVASRRVCEEMISEGRVEVDGSVVTELGVRVDPKTAIIHVDGIRIQLDETLMYYVFNKPKGVVSTMEDPEGRPCISDYLKNRGERLFHVGRLDVSTEGLLLLTNDGELANRLTHPSYEVPKTYLVQVRGPMAQGIGAQMRAGIELEDGIANVDSFRLVDSTPGHILVEVMLHSGRNQIVRRLFEAVGYPVERLVRVQVGPIRINDQRQGSIRALGRQEVGHLLASVGM